MKEDIIGYEVTVRVRKRVTSINNREWVRLSDAPKDNYGYAPAIEKTTESVTDIYSQLVPGLDMGKLVSVVNGLAP